MLEGLTQSVYSDAANVRPRLLTPGGAVTIVAAADTSISVADAARFGYLSALEAVCTVAGTTAGTWTLRFNPGTVTLLVLQQPITTAVIGTRYCWSFPVPWKTGAIGGGFAILNSVATMGTWVWHVNGFHSRT